MARYNKAVTVYGAKLLTDGDMNMDLTLEKKKSYYKNCMFIHGLGQLPTSWDKVISYFPNDVKISCPHLSEIVNGQKVTYENLYKAFENQCNLIKEPLYLCGVSLGAILALHYTLDYPQNVDSLIMIAPQYKMPRFLLGFQNIIFRMMPKRAFQETGFAKKDIISLTNSMKTLDFTSKVKEISCPSLIICGQNDTSNKKAAKILADSIPNAQMSSVKNAGHEVNVETPVKLAALIKEFWFNE